MWSESGNVETVGTGVAPPTPDSPPAVGATETASSFRGRGRVAEGNEPGLGHDRAGRPHFLAPVRFGVPLVQQPAPLPVAAQEPAEGPSRPARWPPRSS